jgi:hypothetical protein
MYWSLQTLYLIGAGDRVPSENGYELAVTIVFIGISYSYFTLIVGSMINRINQQSDKDAKIIKTISIVNKRLNFSIEL